MRRARRHRNTPYRAPRFDNPRRTGAWLPPSLQHRVDTISVWVCRLRRWAPVTGISQELARFDMQKLENPEISGLMYQQGTLFEYEVREYLLEKWGRKCMYCEADAVPLNIEHVVPKARGGTNRVSNLGLSCMPCNQKKGARPIEAFLANKPERLARILAQLKRPLKDAAAVNATRWALFDALKQSGLPVEAASGGLTKWNRHRFDVPKTHALDAACVGSLAGITDWHRPTLTIKASGRGSYQRTRLDAFGFPRGYLTRDEAHSRLPDRRHGHCDRADRQEVWQAQTIVLLSDNFGRNTTYALTAYAPLQPVKWWSVTPVFTGFYQDLQTEYLETTYHNSQLGFQINIQNSFTLPKGFALELSAQYQSKVIFSIASIEPNGDVSVGLKKTFLDGKASVKVNANDIFNTNNIKGDIRYANIDSYFGRTMTVSVMG